LTEAIKQARQGNKISDISKAIQHTIEAQGYSCSRSLTGHGVGKKLHEDPPVPCVYHGFGFSDSILVSGQTLAIEVIYAEGSEKMQLDADGWTLSTKDCRLAGLFEETVLITDNQPEILTN
jgi:methionyl aminopeptidase